MCHRCDAPHNDRDAEANARSEAVVEAAAHALTDRVSEQQQAADVTILSCGDVDVGTESRYQQTDGTAVNVIDAGDQKDQEDDPPAQPGNPATSGDFSSVYVVW